ncbi:translation initiation factor IF-3 [bacterium]|nr:translation initiation factor IF-3 [bacterium]
MRVNTDIRALKVRTIDSTGKQVGILPRDEALNLARTSNLDLVEVAPNADPPVCRIMDYGKYRYEQTKKEKLAKKHQHASRIKEIRLRPNIGEHDLLVKEKRVREFLEHGFKVKVGVRFRGREMAHLEFGKEVLEKLAESVQDVGAVEMKAKVVGRFMTIIIGPTKSAP